MHAHRHKKPNCNYMCNVKAPKYTVDIGGHNTDTSLEILFFLLLCIFLMTFRATFSNEYSGYNFCLVSQRLLVQILAETCNIIIFLFLSFLFYPELFKRKIPWFTVSFFFQSPETFRKFQSWLKSF